MGNEEAKTMLRTMLGLMTIAAGDNIGPLVTKMTEAVDIAITAIDIMDTQYMKIESKENSEEDSNE